MGKSLKEAIKRAKDRLKREERQNITFRLRKDAIERFRAECEKNSVSMSSALEAWILGSKE